jgi:5-methylcytosine-specific restriction enzyme B
MKNNKNRIYFDSWRKVNEPLFSAYIACYYKLSKDNTLDPAEELIKSLNDFGVLGKVKKDDYGSAYVPARELGIFYNDEAGNIVLGENALKFATGKISYIHYMKSYVVNYKTLINNKIITPFQIIRDYSLLNFAEKTSEEIFIDCKEYFSDGTEDKLASDAVAIFLGRAVEAELLSRNRKKYKITNKSVYELIIPETGLTPDEFQKKFLGGSRQAQENYVKEMINKPLTGISNSKQMNHPLNQILYGPPGTGKTYSTITKALNIIGIEYNSYEEAQELFQNELGKRIEFVTMHQSFSYEDFVQGLKPLKQKGNEGITFDYKNGVFKEICRRADDAETGDSGLDITTLTNREIGQIMFFLSKFNGKGKSEKKANDFLGFESDYKAFQGIGEKIGMKPNTLSNHRDKFDFMFSDREGYSARKGWTPRNGQYVLDNSEKWPYKEIYDEMNPKSFEEISKLVKTLLSKTKPITTEIEGNNNHVIILDEINRANISRVFGELIALIEKDKRDGKLTATLPSGESFTVPSNLYIIGTMNTADKSIALVDIALRRRFEFTALYPDTDILSKVLLENKFIADDINQRVNMLISLNRIIRAKKSVDFEIGHSYFMENDTLINILNKQVLPLLNEYFMYDLRKVKEIIEKTQKDKEGKSIQKTGIVFSKKIWEDRGLLVVESINLSEDETEEVEAEETPAEA